MRKSLLSTVATAAVAAAVALSGPVAADDFHGNGHHGSAPDEARTATPIKHLVVIFGENRSFDNYFATYPNATNPAGEPVFKAAGNTPAVNNLSTNPGLLNNNPNDQNSNNSPEANPFRLDRSQANTASHDHAYQPEEEAYDNGKMDLFIKDTGAGGSSTGGSGIFDTNAQVMGYFDGNTVTGLWNYAQHFAMSDNAYTDTFGPSTPGALEVFSGQTNGATYRVGSPTGVSDGQGGYTQNGDTDPGYDTCSSKTSQVMLSGKNIGDLLNKANLTWGSFAGGFNLGLTNANGTTGCARSTVSAIVGGAVTDYTPHHMWFQYFKSTANPTHARPSSIAAVGTSNDGGANHAYDLNDFYAAVKAGNYPSVSYIKMPAYQDSHPGNSDPLDEQDGVVTLINYLQQQPDWKNTAVVITYDDSDGWYDHAYAQPTRASFSSQDALNGTDVCGSKNDVPAGLDGKPVNGRCGPGTRIPFLVISPYAKQNYVSHDQITQASVVRFIEDNWLQGERLGGGSFDASSGSIVDMFDFDHGDRDNKLILDPTTGTVVASEPAGDQGQDQTHGH